MSWLNISILVYLINYIIVCTQLYAISFQNLKRHIWAKVAAGRCWWGPACTISFYFMVIAFMIVVKSKNKLLYIIL